MPSFETRLTWPCGMQRSYKAHGWNLEVHEDDQERQRPCPVHGLQCHRGA